jgi:TDG/mug DNA glycosylase family protein
MKHVEDRAGRLGLGVQPVAIGSCLVFVTPNPSPANAAWSLANLVEWYRQLAAVRDGMNGP